MTMPAYAHDTIAPVTSRPDAAAFTSEQPR
jgi:hypothetical protein